MAQHKYMYNKDTSTSSSLNYIDNNSVANSVLTSTQEDEIEKLKGLKALQNKLNNFDERESRNETTEVWEISVEATEKWLTFNDLWFTPLTSFF